jgi:hypothetical protein
VIATRWFGAREAGKYLLLEKKKKERKHRTGGKGKKAVGFKTRNRRYIYGVYFG